MTVSKCPATKSFESEAIFAEVGSKAKVLLCRKKSQFVSIRHFFAFIDTLVRNLIEIFIFSKVV